MRLPECDQIIRCNRPGKQGTGIRDVQEYIHGEMNHRTEGSVKTKFNKVKKPKFDNVVDILRARFVETPMSLMLQGREIAKAKKDLSSSNKKLNQEETRLPPDSYLGKRAPLNQGIIAIRERITSAQTERNNLQLQLPQQEEMSYTNEFVFVDDFEAGFRSNKLIEQSQDFLKFSDKRKKASPQITDFIYNNYIRQDMLEVDLFDMYQDSDADDENGNSLHREQR